MSATHAVHCTQTACPVLYVAFELGWTSWKMAFTVGAGQPPRIRSVPARSASVVLNEIKDWKGHALRDWKGHALRPEGPTAP